MKINQPQYIVDEHGNKTSVILDLKIFTKLLEELEDLYDVVEAEKIIKKGGRTFSSEEVEMAHDANCAKKTNSKKGHK